MTNFEITEGPFREVEWLLGAVNGEEGLSELFVFHLTVLSHSPALVAASYADLHDGLVGRTVALSMHADDKVRHGIIASIEVEADAHQVGGLMLRLVMRPRAWLLTLRKNTRIFQSKYVHEIASAVLAESGICHRWSLLNTYPKRVLCTQYEETDYAFVSRILAEEGIFWFFEQTTAFTPTPAQASASSSTMSKVAAVGAIAGAVLGAAAPVLGSMGAGGTAEGAVGTLGSLGSIIGDAATAAVDPEADEPIDGASGQGGPASSHPLEVFVFADRIAGYVPGGAPDPSRETRLASTDHGASPLLLRYGAPTTGFVTNAVTSLAGLRSVATRSVEIRDYNFRRPMALLSKGTEVDDTASVKAPLEYYEHHGEYEKPDIEDEQALIRLEQLRASSSVVKGESTSPRMSPGYSVLLTQAPLPFHDSQFVPVKVFHEAYLNELGPSASRAEPSESRVVEAMASLLRDLEGTRRRFGEGELRALARRALGAAGSAPKAYQNRFEWVAADVVFRPPLPARIRHAVNETAIVVGPAGQAIYVDNYGRVKVQFHWDRENKYNENSSCWIRVLSTWAGAGYGFQFFPRVGMEVVVTFLGGDPDRPVISGTLYNATHPTPEPLPQRLTRSGMRSQTVPGGGGFNELSFEDAQGVERVFIHAQKDLHEIVNDAHTTTVRGAQTTTVGGTQKSGVSENRVAAIGGHDAELVGKNKAAHVGGNRVAEVARNSSDLVHGNATTEIRGVSITDHASDELRVVRGDSNLTVHGRQVVHVVSKAEGPKSSASTYVDGSSYHTATERVVIRSQNADASASTSSIRLECGETFIELTGEGITLSAKNITLKSTENFKLDGKNVDMNGSDHLKVSRSTAAVELTANGFALGGVTKAEIATASAKLTLDGGNAELTGSTETRIKGGKVKLASGNASDSKNDSPANDDHPNVQPMHLKMAFGHPHGTSAFEPISSTRYRLTSDGFVHEASTDGQGAIDVEVPKGTTSATIVLFVEQSDDYKTRYSTPLTFEVRIQDALHAAADAQGARLRLRNLGYAPGVDTAVTALDADPLTVQAIEEFQRDEGIRISGKLDEDQTSSTLCRAFGET